MKRVAFVIGVVLLLLIGGGLTAQIAQQGGLGAIPVFVIQTDNPDASVFASTPWKAEQLVLMIGFILFNLIGIGVTTAVVVWLLSRGVKSARSQERAPAERSSDTTEAA